MARLLLQRGTAIIYLLAFAGALRQGKALLGERGLLPISAFLRQTSFRQAPSFFHWRFSDRWFAGLAGCGALLSALLAGGAADHASPLVSIIAWLFLWMAYQSIVNVGQQFYAFGWESMLLEAGFFCAFLGPAAYRPSPLPILMLRWMLFRVEIGAGLIKLRHDRCWRDLTCLDYHYETQPMPNPCSWYFHRLPRWMHRLGVLGSHLVQLVLPFALFAPQPVAAWAGVLVMAHQLWLIVSGNYAWLNWLTAVLACSCLSDRWFPSWISPPTLHERPPWLDLLLCLLTVLTGWLSVKPVRNLCSKNQAMNRCYNVLRIVNTYGAFGSVTRTRHELVVEGTDDLFERAQSVWKEYEFWGKPGDPRRRPPQFAPYHLRLDWLMWFLPLRIGIRTPRRDPRQRLAHRYDTWFTQMVEKLLQGDGDLLRLFRFNPFADKPPAQIRVLVYHYRYTTARERAETGHWWQREQVGVYLPPIGRTPQLTLRSRSGP